MIKTSNIDDTKEFVDQLRTQLSTLDLTNLTYSDVLVLKNLAAVGVLLSNQVEIMEELNLLNAK